MQNNDAAAKNTGQANQDQAKSEFVIQRIYVKDISLETPNSPQLFLEQWKPATEVELNAKTAKLADDVYDVELAITVTVKIQEKIAYLVEVHQSGVFLIKGFSDAQLHRMLGSYCPNILFPYAREVISELVLRAGFPPLYLTPVNFDALYEQQSQQKQAQATANPENKTAAE